MTEVNTPDAGIDKIEPLEGTIDEMGAIDLLTNGRSKSAANAEPGNEAGNEEADDEPDAGADPDESPDNDEVEAEKNADSEGKDDPAKPIIEIDGKPLTAEDVRKGFLRQSDYTRKTQEVAEYRKAIEAERAQVAAIRGELTNKLEAAIAFAMPQMQEPDWQSLAQTDPLRFVVERENWRINQEKLARLTGELQQLKAIEQQEQQAQVAALLQSEREKLVSVIPEWKDSAKAKADVQAIKAFVAEAYGFSDADLDGLYDHRAVMVLRDAMAYRAALASKASAENKAKDKPPVTLKSGNRAAPDAIKSQKHAESMRRLKKSGSVDDAVRALIGS